MEIAFVRSNRGCTVKVENGLVGIFRKAEYSVDFELICGICRGIVSVEGLSVAA